MASLELRVGEDFTLTELYQRGFTDCDYRLDNYVCWKKDNLRYVFKEIPNKRLQLLYQWRK